ncbi:uncharacterized protein LOC112493671 [Cephus cinctus]|uniref:Uncharacterized protein LOC112493671 n=1 Tax=Cephus cinctus TaxID=211228 RepID=A0AAJ7R7R3_CEPCN|nr:uncharacterized protein LOC112493671 [Cephus cinctus]
MLKLGRENVEQTMSEVLKPVVTPLQKLVTASRPERNLIKDEIKDEVKQDVEADDTFRSADEPFKSLKNDSFEEEEEEGKHDDEDEGDNDDADVSVNRNDPTQRYLDMLQSRENKQLDTAYGDLMQKHGITLYSTFSNLKASICERFNRTLKSKMWMQFSLQGNYRWLDILSDVVSSYNNSKHRTIGMKPTDVTDRNEKDLLQRVYKKFKVKTTLKRPKFSRYTPNWTTEIFTISRVKNTDPVTYNLKDYQDHPIEGGFYEHELTSVKYPDIYLVEKILRKRGNKLFVKWLGTMNIYCYY